MTTVAEVVLMAVTVYAAIGAIFAVFFATAGVSRLDPDAEGSSLAFRLLILPGTIALWPMLLMKLSRGKRTRPEVGDS